jgi:tetratricopeptide (TPR) repeat protein
MRVQYRIGCGSPVIAPPVADKRPAVAARQPRARSHRRAPALSLMAALLLSAAGCASLDPAGSKAWRIDPVLDVRHSAIAAHGYYAVGRYQDGMRAWDKAAAAYQLAVEADPRHAEAHNGLGVALARLGRHEEAESALRQAVGIEPRRAHMRSNLGFMMLQAGRVSEALAELKAAVRLDPDDATARGNLREAVARREGMQTGESHATAAQPVPPAAAMAPAGNPPPAVAVAPPPVSGQGAPALAAGAITVPAPIITASVAAPLPRTVSVPAPLAAAASIQGAGSIGIFDQPTVAAWPRADDAATGSFEDMARARPADTAASLDRRFPSAPPAGPATAMPVRLAAFSMPVALPPPIAATPDPAAPGAKFRLELSNGNGVSGMAARLGKWLAHEGLPTSRLTNLRPFAQEQTLVEYRTGHEAAAWRVMQALPLEIRSNPVLHEGLTSDVRVVLGSDWRHGCIAREGCSSARTIIAARSEAR